MRIGEMVAMNYRMINNMNRYNQMANVSAQRIASGKRVNSAADDPSAIGKIARLTAQINENKITTQNISDGIDLTKTMDSALSQMSEAAQNLSQLAVKYSDPSLSASDKASLESQAAGYMDEISNYLQNTDYNGQKVFQQASFNIASSLGNYTINTAKFKIAADGSGGYDITDNSGTTLSGQSMATILNSDFVQNNILNPIAQARGNVGVNQTVLEKRMDFQNAQQPILTNSLSNIEDADIAQETADMTKYQTLAALNNKMITAYTSQMQSQIMSLFSTLA